MILTPTPHYLDISKILMPIDDTESSVEKSTITDANKKMKEFNSLVKERNQVLQQLEDLQVHNKRELETRSGKLRKELENLFEEISNLCVPHKLLHMRKKKFEFRAPLIMPSRIRLDDDSQFPKLEVATTGDQSQVGSPGKPSALRRKKSMANLNISNLAEVSDVTDGNETPFSGQGITSSEPSPSVTSGSMFFGQGSLSSEYVPSILDRVQTPFSNHGVTSSEHSPSFSIGTPIFGQEILSSEVRHSIQNRVQTPFFNQGVSSSELSPLWSVGTPFFGKNISSSTSGLVKNTNRTQSSVHKSVISKFRISANDAKKTKKEEKQQEYIMKLKEKKKEKTLKREDKDEADDEADVEANTEKSRKIKEFHKKNVEKKGEMKKKKSDHYRKIQEENKKKKSEAELKGSAKRSRSFFEKSSN
jgi:hypothetical protein